MATKKRAGGRKSASRGASKGSKRSRRPAMKKSASSLKAGRKAARKPARKQSPVARVKRVAREVVQQATVAVSAGVEALKDVGENLVERATSRE